MVAGDYEKNFLDYYDGGREGVQKRFGEVITDRLKKISIIEAHALAKHVEIDFGSFREIITGNYDGVNYRLIEGLAGPLDFTMDEGLGEASYDSHEREKLLERMRREGVCALNGDREFALLVFLMNGGLSEL